MELLHLEKWMSFLPDSIPICKIKIPGTHNSGAGENPSNPLSNIVNFAAQCHTMSIEQQIYNGIRYIDLRIKLDRPDQLNIYHGYVKYNQNLNDIFAILQNFLTTNPSEAIFLRFHREDSGSERRKKISDDEFMNIFISHLDRYSHLFYNFLDNKSVECLNSNPTLNEIRGKIMFFGVFHVENPQIYTNQYKMFPIMKYTSYSLKCNKNGIEEKIKAVREGFEKSLENDGYIFVNEVNAVGSLPVISSIPYPKRMAETINKEIEDLLQTKPNFQGVLMFDFPELTPSGKLIETVINLNF